MTEEQASKLSELLPSGWLPKANERLRDMDLEFSAGFISQVKNGKKQHGVIEDVLFALAEEEQRRLAEVDERIANLKR
jgi:hypothetical protein